MDDSCLPKFPFISLVVNSFFFDQGFLKYFKKSVNLKILYFTCTENWRRDQSVYMVLVLVLALPSLSLSYWWANIGTSGWIARKPLINSGCVSLTLTNISIESWWILLFCHVFAMWGSVGFWFCLINDEKSAKKI